MVQPRLFRFRQVQSIDKAAGFLLAQGFLDALSPESLRRNAQAMLLGGVLYRAEEEVKRISSARGQLQTPRGYGGEGPRHTFSFTVQAQATPSVPNAPAKTLQPLVNTARPL